MKLLSLILILGGVGLAFYGYQAQQTLGYKVNSALRGQAREKVFLIYCIGTLFFVTGLVIFFKKKT